MPLFFTPSAPTRNKRKCSKAEMELGHMALATAYRPQGTNTIKICIGDTWRGSIQDDEIRKLANRFVNASALVRPSDHYLHKIFTHTDVPHQPEPSNACGLFVILFAWAEMLDIPIHLSKSLRNGRRASGSALKIGFEIVNLGLAGCMDARTVQAFLNYYGYTEKQDPEILEDDVRLHVDAMVMNQDLFARALRQQHLLDAEG
ncbi:hypothetical protein MMC21_005316 [Puttea exsequens]|nr:hypothetical protein [Puttea exsequens]